jgi:hypothetical protein
LSKITVITDAAGNIVAMGHGHLSEKTARKSGSREPQGGLRAGPGQKLHELDLPGNLENVKTWSELHEKVLPHVKQ